MSEDFLRYLQDKVGGEKRKSHDQEDHERHDDDALPPPYYSGADKLVRCDDITCHFHGDCELLLKLYILQL